MNLKNMIILEWLFQEPIEKEIKNKYKPRSLKQIARDNIRLNDNQLNKKSGKNMPNPYCFTDRNLKVGFKNNLDSHHINHANSKLTFIPNYIEFGIEVRYIIKNIKKLSVIFARLMNQYRFKYQTQFSARFDKQNEDNQVVDENKL